MTQKRDQINNNHNRNAPQDGYSVKVTVTLEENRRSQY